MGRPSAVYSSRWVSRGIKWLYPGMHVKRWLGLLFLGVVAFSLGVALILTNFYRIAEFGGDLGIFIYFVTLQPIPRLTRGILLAVFGAGIGLWAFVEFNRSVVGAVISPMQDLVDVLHRRRQLGRGPKIAVIGGGTGLSTLLRGLKEYSTRLTAIVTVADDGGSSGRLRRETGMLPPGDFRNCMAALSEGEPLLRSMLQYRFDGESSLDGHSLGNLLIAALWKITGSFEEALLELSRVLAVRGKILPSSLYEVTLCAELADDRQVMGESQIGHSGQAIRRVYLDPVQVVAYPQASQAILAADLVVIGPGSLYTSVLPNLLVDGITAAIRASSAVKVYVCNVATEVGETEGFGVREHIDAIERHVGIDLFDMVLANSNVSVMISPNNAATLVALNGSTQSPAHYVVGVDVIDLVDPRRHDSRKLARALIDVCLRTRRLPARNGHPPQRQAAPMEVE